MSRKCPSSLLSRWTLTLFCLIQRVVLYWTTRVPLENPFGSLRGKSSQQTSSCIKRWLARILTLREPALTSQKRTALTTRTYCYHQSSGASANCGDSSTIADKIEDISKQVSGLAESITFMQNMQRSLECVVCKGLVKSPIVSKCCGRVIGCKRCVRRWLDVHATCPHCSSVIEENFPLKGFDDVISCLQFAMDEKFPTPKGYESLSCPDGSGLDWLKHPFTSSTSHFQFGQLGHL